MRKEAVLAAAFLSATVALGAVAAVFLAMGYPLVTGNPAPEAASIAGALAYCGVGALILSKSRAHAIGLVFCLGALAVQFENAGAGYLDYTLDRAPSEVTSAATVGVFADAMWVPSIALGIVFVLLFFPTGSLPSPRWKPIFWIATSIALLSVPLTLFAPGPLYYAETLDNPLGIEAARELIEGAQALTFAGIFLPVLASLGAVVIRYRRATLDERQQMKWFLFASALLVIGIPIGIALDTSVWGALIFEVLFAFIPVSVAIGILRYRLYAIDAIINRALVYGALTAILAGAYLGIVFALQQVLPVANDSDLAVAASTLAVAALFRPARARVQGFIDRRFFRHKYDSIATLQSFAARLRDEVELEIVRADLLQTTIETVQPVHASLWLRST